MKFYLVGGEKYQRDAVLAAAEWFATLNPESAAVVSVELCTVEGAWGWCEQLDGGGYSIALDNRSGLRLLLQTLMHELQHVRQFESDEWIGDGEEQAAAAEVLADAAWLIGLI